MDFEFYIPVIEAGITGRVEGCFRGINLKSQESSRTKLEARVPLSKARRAPVPGSGAELLQRSLTWGRKGGS